MPNPLEEPLARLQAKIQANKSVILAEAKAIGLEFFNENFEKQGWQGETFVPWKLREKKDKPGKHRNILILNTHLIRSLRGYADLNSVTWHAGGPGIDYAKIHNEGGTISHPGGARTLSFRRTQKGQMRFTKDGGKYKTIAQARVHLGSYNITMPRRHYMGPSPVLFTRIDKMILKTLLK